MPLADKGGYDETRRPPRSLPRSIGDDDSPYAEATTDARLCPGPAHQEVSAKWGVSSTNRRIRIYTLTTAGAKRLEREVARFEQMLEGIRLVLAPVKS